MNYSEALKNIGRLGNFSLPPGLSRVNEALLKLGNPQKKFKSIHIAGTNGKGSVSAMIASVMKQSGYKTGMFVSPFIINFRERIQINGEFISQEDVASLAEKVLKLNIPLKEFEFITVLGFLYFAEKNCDVAVVETGLGGKLDATNSLDKTNKLVSVITKISLDHTALLGDTFEKIAREKCGIITKTAVSYPQQPVKALEVIRQMSKNLIIPKISELEILKSDIFGSRFVYRGNVYDIPLAGKHQILNAVTAIEALLAANTSISLNDIREGLKNTFFPARLELVSENPTVIIDGAHNPDGALCIKNFLFDCKKNVTAVIGMLADKDCESFLKILMPVCGRAITVTVPGNERSLSAKELQKKASAYCPNVTACESVSQALALAKEYGEDIIVTGSLYLASAARTAAGEIFR